MESLFNLNQLSSDGGLQHSLSQRGCGDEVEGTKFAKDWTNP